jgi:hypothetical protein
MYVYAENIGYCSLTSDRLTLPSEITTKGEVVLLNKQHYLQQCSVKRQSSPVTGLEWHRGFQEVKVPTFHDNGTGWW